MNNVVYGRAVDPHWLAVQLGQVREYESHSVASVPKQHLTGCWYTSSATHFVRQTIHLVFQLQPASWKSWTRCALVGRSYWMTHTPPHYKTSTLTLFSFSFFFCFFISNHNGSLFYSVARRRFKATSSAISGAVLDILSTNYFYKLFTFWFKLFILLLSTGNWDSRVRSFLWTCIHVRLCNTIRWVHKRSVPLCAKLDHKRGKMLFLTDVWKWLLQWRTRSNRPGRGFSLAGFGVF